MGRVYGEEKPEERGKRKEIRKVNSSNLEVLLSSFLFWAVV
jgi:hypothetical protein